MTQHVNKADFAKFVGISPRQVSNWIRAGMPAEGAGKRGSALRIDTAKAISWLLLRNDTKQSDELGKQRRRLVAAQALKAELQSKQISGELVLLEEAQIVLNQAMIIVRQTAQAMPGRMAAELAQLTDQAIIKQRLQNEIREMLTAMADRLASMVPS